jgi:hypothetical protein
MQLRSDLHGVIFEVNFGYFPDSDAGIIDPAPGLGYCYVTLQMFGSVRVGLTIPAWVDLQDLHQVGVFG